MQKLPVALTLIGLVSACTVQEPVAVGWTSDPSFARSTDAFVLVHGPKADVDGVTREAAALGYAVIDSVQSPSGAAFALMKTPVALDADGGNRFWEITQRYRVMVGPAIPPTSPHKPRR